MEENPFVVLKFLPTNEDPDTYFDVGLRKWICTDLDDEMCGKTYWPPNSNSVTQLVKTEESSKTNWPKHDMEVKRFYNTYPKARAAISGFLADSNYETEIEQHMGRGKRRKKIRQITSSDSDSDSNASLKLTTKIIPAPPPVFLNKAFSNTQHCDSDSNSNTSSKLMKRNVPTSSTIKLSEVEKLQEEKFEEEKLNKMIKTKRLFSKHFHVNLTGKKIQTAKEIAISKMKKPELLTSLSRTAKSPLKSVSSSVSISSPTSFNSLLTNSPVNSDTSAVQEEENLFLNVQSSMQDTIPEDNLFIDRTSTQDSMTTNNFNRNSKNIAQCSNSDSNCENSSKLSNSSTSYRRTMFKEQLHDKNKEETSLYKTKLDRTLVIVQEVSGKLDILNMNMSKIMRVIIPSEKRITRPEKMPALPLNTKQDLEEFNKFLEADHNLAAACHYMSSHIKLNVKNPERKSATNMLTKILSNTLASEINCDGGHGKIAFKSLKLYDLFQGTLQTAFPNSDLIEANAALAGWLKDAKWRKQCDGSLGNRKRKS
ncbi:unnamed protein product [Lasius platythorax]|uniref:DUF4806 domain-containing protein n=1 Tax=Lasius platythorax TaxID=488582 RepID=A0AAV2NXW7_9HYME